ncbi:MAG: hypothetical protein Q9M28_08590, partial [Mariprofundaceae bacterium]|nr:hypothetical protein [Mariprofundaceae bacterium]
LNYFKFPRMSIAYRKASIEEQELWKSTALLLKGSERRCFMGRIVKLLGWASLCRENAWVERLHNSQRSARA